MNTLSFRRSRVQIAAPFAAVCAVLLLGLWIRVADAQQQQLAQQQVEVLSLRNKSNRLEELFVSLVEKNLAKVAQ